MIILGVICVSFFACVSVGGLAYASGYSDGNKDKKHPNRRGVIKYKEFKWDDAGYWDTYAKSRKATNVVIVIEELDKIDNQSKIKISCIDGTGITKIGREKMRKRLGQWWETSLIDWEEVILPEPELVDPITEVKDKLSEQDRIIKTPLKDLVKDIANDEIAGV